MSLLLYLWYPILKTVAFFSYSERVIREEVNPNFKVSERCGEASYFFINADHVIDFPRPISPKFIYIGGLGISDSKPLEPVCLFILQTPIK